jgi:uncharacterized membrane protein YesL
MKVAQGDGNIIRTYFEQFKANLKGATPVWLLFLAAMGFIYIDLKIFAPQEEGAFAPMLLPVYVLAIILAAVFVWIFPLMARIENTLPARFKNAMILALSNLPRTLAMMIVYAVAAFVFSQDMRLLPIAFVMGISFPTYLCVLIYRSVIDDIVKRMQGDDSDDEPA